MRLCRLSPLGSMHVTSLGIGTWWDLYAVRLPVWMCSDDITLVTPRSHQIAQVPSCFLSGESWVLVESSHYWTISCSFSLYVTCSLWKLRLFQNTLRCMSVSLTPTRDVCLPGLAAVSSWGQCSHVCGSLSLCPTFGTYFFLQLWKACPLGLFFLLFLLLVWIVWSSITVLQTDLSLEHLYL